MMAALALLVGVSSAAGEQIGTGCVEGVDCTPPAGWRSWNTFGGDVSQQLMTDVMDAMVDDSLGRSLASLGYVDVGLDDNYQECGTGVNGSFHGWSETDAAFVNLVRNDTFPDLKAMSDHAHELGLRSGFYENNCICEEKGEFVGDAHIQAHYQGDVLDIVRYDFDSVKLDGCGQFLDLELYQALMNETGQYFMIENCHWGWTVPTEDWCPFSMYRSSQDIRAEWRSMMWNLQTTRRFQDLNTPLSRPGCWAYPDMLEVGLLATHEEDRTHFGAWCVTSSPLVLGHDVRNGTLNAQIWDIIANTEAIAINQAWAGHPGRLVKQAGRAAWTAELQDAAGADEPADSERALGLRSHYQVWSKPLPSGAAAVLVLSNSPSTLDPITIDLTTLGFAEDAQVTVRDVWAHEDLFVASGSFDTPSITTHDSVFYTLTPV